MSDLNEKDIAEYQETKQENSVKVEGKETGFVNPLTKTTIAWDLWEWSSLITELSSKEIELDKLKQKIFEKEQLIINETDFKAVYGKNNSDVRKLHLDQFMAEDYKAKKDLEYSVDYINRRIPYLKSLIRAKSVIMEVKE